MKMRELERRTGVNRETIRVYLRQGLLPEPRRAARNVADYGEEHVRGILSIRRLQTEQRLPLARIKRALEGDPVAVPADAGILTQLEHLIGAQLGLDEGLVPLAALRKRNPAADTDARALQRIGAVHLQRRMGRVLLSRVDAQLVALWGDMRAAGFTEAQGFDPTVTRMHVDAAERLAKLEVRAFLAGLAGREHTVPAANMAETALSTMLAFFGLVRTRAVLGEFRARAAESPHDAAGGVSGPARARKPADTPRMPARKRGPR
jgi:DNA-binding transcriptional MerR regulator